MTPAGETAGENTGKTARDVMGDAMEDAPGPRGLFTIPPAVSFADALAKGVLRAWGGAPLGLARITILLPNRRACRTLQEAFLRAGEGRAVILPRLIPLGESPNLSSNSSNETRINSA